MTEFVDSMVAQALNEYQKFNKGEGKETDDPYCGYVGKYWSIGLKNSHIDGRTTYHDARGRPFRPAWSAAFICFLVRAAGATDAEFLFSEGHVHYVVNAIRDCEAENTTAAFWGRDPRRYTPKVGDLINAGRGSAAEVTFRNVLDEYGPKVAPKGNFLPSHSDLIIEIDTQRSVAITIGGNVSVDTVGRKKWELDDSGILVKADELISVLECRK